MSINCLLCIVSLYSGVNGAGTVLWRHLANAVDSVYAGRQASVLRNYFT